ncbi:MAG: hypothetical protein ACTHOH_04015, partial [Lysobacteraceae bacterium]
MDMFYRILVAAHGLVGLVALVTFWLAAFAKKGSPLHLRTGRLYMAAMIGIVVTAIPMAAIIAARGKPGIATFLGYLVVITATGLWLGRRAVRRKRDQTAFRDTAYLAVALANLAASAVVFAVGLRMSQVLLMGFSAVGTLNGVQMLMRRRRPMDTARWWLKEHFSAMIGCGVATHIAFLAIGLDRLIRAFGIDPPGWYHLIAWFLPLSLSFVVAAWLNRKYMPKPVAPAPGPARG